MCWVPPIPPGLARVKFAGAPVARLATSDADGQPHLVVVTFATRGDQIFTTVDRKPKTTLDLKRLRNVRQNPLVTVLADHYEDAWEALWWVRADGVAQIVTDPAEMAGPIQMLADRYWQYRENRPEGPVITITVHRWTGWSATAGTAATS